jgi:microsomal dipeptidase-like Zn-dependent dipeptidase
MLTRLFTLLSALVLGLLCLGVAAPAQAAKCGDIHFGGLLNANNSSLRQHSRRLTFARQTGKIIGTTGRTWNTYIKYDLNKADLDLRNTNAKGRVTVTVCTHSHEKDPGRSISEFTLGSGKTTTVSLEGLKEKYLSVAIRGQNRDSFAYEVRLRRPNQGRMWQHKKNTLPPQTGFADLHNHQASNLANGGEFNPAYVHGEHDGPLSSCNGTHSTFRKIAGVGTGEHHAHPNNDSKKPNRWWPHYADGSHAQTHVDHLKKAHKEGLRLVLATAVSNQMLCFLTSKNSTRIRQCDDMDSAKAQLKAMRDFDAKHDWYQIAYDPWDARKIISEGKLAVVLGIEVSNLMPNSHGRWTDQLDELYDMGVRSIELAHEADSRFSGNAHQHGRMFKILNGLKRFSRPVQMALKPLLQQSKEQLENGEVPTYSDLMEFFAKTRNPKFCDAKYRKQGIDCNKIGLSVEGKALVRELIKKNMFIPLDHVSRRARKDIFEISKANRYYPLFASHSRPDSVMHSEERRGGAGTHEYMLTDEDLTMIRETGGMLGLRTGDNTMREIPGCIKGPVTCWGSTQSLAQNVCWSAKTGMALALGTDFSGPVSMTAPRFSHASATTLRWDGLPAACPRNVELGYVSPFGYSAPFRNKAPSVKSGNDRDFAVRGLSDTGQEGSLIRDLKSLGAPVAQTRLEHSAENFLLTWERQFQRQGKLSDTGYRKRMGTTQKRYATLKAEPAYDSRLKGLFKKCAALKAKGSKRCDSIADWNQMLIDNAKKAETCPLGRNRVAFVDGQLFCQKSIPKAIRTKDCAKEVIDGHNGSTLPLAGYCAWNQLHKGKSHFLVRRLKEHKCPATFSLIKAKKDSLKPYCKALVASPIAQSKCRGWGGQVGAEVEGYCVKNAGSYFHARRLKGYNKEGERKCPTPMHRVQFNLADTNLYCKGLVATPISESNCTSKKKGKTGLVPGHCTRKEGFYQQVWKLKGHNKKGERKCQAPLFKLRVANSPSTLYCKGGLAIAESKCSSQGGSTSKVNGYCAFNKGDWFHVRKLKGHNKSGLEKCPNLLKRVDLKPGSGIQYCKSALAISKDACSKNRGSISSALQGYCSRKEAAGYTRVWKLKGYDKNGEFKYKCPTGLFKVTVQNEQLFCKKSISTKISASKCTQQSGSSNKLVGYCSWQKDHHYLVRPLKATVSSVPPKCSSGESYETRNPLNKDRCKKTQVKTSALQCRLGALDKKKNWTGPHTKNGADECRSKKGKKAKGVKCSSGYKYASKSGRDTCTKTSYDYRTPSCPSGTKYKSQSGKDACLK